MGWVIWLLLMVNGGQYLWGKWLRRQARQERARALVHKSRAEELNDIRNNLQGRLDALGSGIDFTAQNAVDGAARDLADECGDNLKKLRVLNYWFTRGMASVAVFHAETQETLAERCWVGAVRSMGKSSDDPIVDNLRQLRG